MPWRIFIGIGIIASGFIGVIVSKYKSKDKLSSIVIQALPIVFVLAIMLGMSMKTPLWMDEYVFYRLASQFPEYSTTKDWLFVDRPTTLNPSVDWEEIGLDREKAFGQTYDTPVYPHTPLAVASMVPLVRGLNWLAEKDIIPTIEEEPGYWATNEDDIPNLKAETMTTILRIVPMVLFGVALWLIFKLLYQKVGKSAYLFSLPVATSVMLLPGNYLFYWDAFMMFFFVATLYLMETRPKGKWHYLTACLLVNTKMFLGIAFLFPLVVLAFARADKRKWLASLKMSLPILSILPHYITTWIVTGEPFYVFTHYIAQIPTHNFTYTLWKFPDLILTLTIMGVPFFLIMTVPIFKHYRKYPAYVAFWLVGVAYAWGGGLGLTHMSTLVYISALIFPIVAHEWRLIDRIQNRFKRQKVKV